MIRNRQREDAEVDEAERKLVPRLVVAVLALVVGLTGAVSASPGSGASGVVLAQGRMPGRLKIKTREASDVVVQQVTLQPGGFTGWHTHPGVVLVVVLIVFRGGRSMRPTVVAVGIAAAAVAGMCPGNRIDFEDAHVVHQGGEMFPQEYQVARFVFSGGWLLRPGESMSFLAKRGPAHLRYAAEGGATIQIGARAFVLPSTPTNVYNVVPVDVDRQGRVEVGCLSGTVNLDWMRHD